MMTLKFNALKPTIALCLMTILPVIAYADSADEIRYRVQKVGKLNISGQAAPVIEMAAQASTPTKSNTMAESETMAEPESSISAADLYQTGCFACHGTGAAGAPKLGDKAAWADRIVKGEDVLLDNAINGFNAMPPRGASSLTDDELKAVVAHMIKSVQ